MALTRKFLKGLGIEAENIDLIIDAHVEAVDALKEERDGLKVEADKVKGLEKELNDAKEQANNDSEWQKKYEKEHADFESYKTKLENEKKETSKKELFTAILKESNIAEQFVDDVLKQSDLSKLELLEDGTLKDVDKLKEKIASDYSRFIVTTETAGASTTTPPRNDNGGTDLEHMSMEEYIAARKR